MEVIDDESAFPASGGSFPTKLISSKRCHHGLVTEIWTSMTGKNPCRRCQRCPATKGRDCRFFEWVNDELPEFQKSCIRRRRQQRDSYEIQLKCKTDELRVLGDEKKLLETELLTLKSAVDNTKKMQGSSEFPQL